MVSTALFAPVMFPPLLSVAVLFFQLYTSPLPVAITENVAVSPGHKVELKGCVRMTGAAGALVQPAGMFTVIAVVASAHAMRKKGTMTEAAYSKLVSGASVVVTVAALAVLYMRLR